MSFRNIEFLLRAKLQAGLDAIRADDSILDIIFEDLSVDSRTGLKQWLLTHDVAILLSWIRSAENLPAWSIQMIGETPVRIPIGTEIDNYQNDDGSNQDERGEYVRKAYQIHTLSDNPDVTIVLSVILQHILKSMRQDMATDGFYEMQTATQDVLDLKQDYLPVFIYGRQTFVTVLVEDTFVKIDTTAHLVEVGDAKGIDADGFIQVTFPS